VSQITVPPPPDVGEVGAGSAPPPRRRRSRRSSVTRDVIEVLLLALALYVVITFALQTVRVDGTSMVPTLEDGNLLFADKVSYHLHAPGRGDIVILQPPDAPSTDFIKRVIGIPGDVIEIVPNYPDKSGHTRAAVEVKPNGQGSWQVLDEPYLPDQTADPWTQEASCCGPDGRFSTTPAPFTIPQDQYFVLGDNRNASRDSRMIGLIPRGNILGRAWLRIWPLGHFGFFGSGPTLVAAAILPFGLLKLRRRLRNLA
jgi:signal peptidase I